MHPLKKLPIENLFPSLHVFHNQINTLRKKREIWKTSDQETKYNLKKTKTIDFIK
jgi:hypothetical protein